MVAFVQRELYLAVVVPEHVEPYPAFVQAIDFHHFQTPPKICFGKESLPLGGINKPLCPWRKDLCRPPRWDSQIFGVLKGGDEGSCK